ncbi:MAG: DUF2752 domain-containing protein [Pseudonocardiaceae bacterium]
MVVAAVRASRLRMLAAPAGAVALAGTGCAAIWLGDPTTPGGLLPVCPSHALFGVLCPGCGGMRMLYSLLHGDLGAAAHYNAVALAMLPLVAVAWAVWTAGCWRGRPVASWPRQRWVTVGVVAVLVIWSVMRNLGETMTP